MTIVAVMTTTIPNAPADTNIIEDGRLKIYVFPIQAVFR